MPRSQRPFSREADRVGPVLALVLLFVRGGARRLAAVDSVRLVPGHGQPRSRLHPPRALVRAPEEAVELLLREPGLANAAVQEDVAGRRPAAPVPTGW